MSNKEWFFSIDAVEAYHLSNDGVSTTEELGGLCLYEFALRLPPKRCIDLREVNTLPLKI